MCFKKHYKLIIFDLDGTVLNTLNDLADSANFALASQNLPERSLSEVRHFVGNGIRNLIERCVPEGTDTETVDKVFAAFKEHYKDHCADKTCPYDGILDLLGMLNSKKFRLAVLSNKSDASVKTLCEKYFPGCFEFVYGERAGIPRKPSPDAVFSIIEEAGVKKKDTVYIGDSEVDIRTAQNAGLDSIIVDWGFRDSDVLSAAGAELILHSPEEVGRFLTK